MRRWSLRFIGLLAGAWLLIGSAASAQAVVIGTGSPVSVGSFASEAAASPDGSLLYVTVQSENAVKVVDIANEQVVASIAVGTWPRGVALSPDGAKAYVVNSFDGTVSTIDTATNTVTQAIPLGQPQYSYPWSIKVSPDGSKLYVSGMQSGLLSVVDLDTGAVSSIGLQSYYGGGVALNSDGSRAYVMSAQGLPDPTLTIVDTATGATSALPFPGASGMAMTSAVVSPNGARLYTAVGSNLVVVDTQNRTADTYAISGMSLSGYLSLSHDGERLYVSRIDAGVIDEYETSSMTVVDSIPLVTPGALVLSSDDTMLAAVHGFQQSLITAFDLAAAPRLFCELPVAVVGEPYSASLLRGGAPAPAVSLSLGSLPEGLSLSTDGTISGTPREAGESTFEVAAVNSAGTASCAVRVRVDPVNGAGAEVDGGANASGVAGPKGPQRLSDTGTSSTGVFGPAAVLVISGAVILLLKSRGRLGELR